MMRIVSAPVPVMMAAALAFFSCANDGGQSARTGAENAFAGNESGGGVENNGDDTARYARESGQSSEEPAQYAQTGAVAAAKEKPAGKSAGGGVIEVKEKMFIAQTNEIYINSNDYFGKTIKYEGMFHEVKARGKTYRYVIRYGPGCCPGDVSAAGFEVAWDKGYPKHNDWVEITGVLEKYDDNGISAMRLALKSLNVLTKRGAERVTR